MGGSGSGTFSAYDKQELLKKLRMSEESSRDIGFETTINEYINNLQAQYNARNHEVIRGYLDEIKDVLSEDIEDTVKLLYGGSVAKHTYVDGISDVDALVLLGDSDLISSSPSEVRDYFCKKLKERYPNLPVKTGRLAVTINFPTAEVQLLPAVKYKTGYRIADITGKQWSFIKPRKFSEQLTKVNQDNGNKVVPTIKLVKAINSTLPESRQMKSYHIESLAVQIFKKYDGAKTPKAMLTHFFKTAPKEILTALPDITGQSTHVDAYLGKSGSLTRRVVSDALSLISRRMQAADNARSSESWKNILDAT